MQDIQPPKTFDYPKHNRFIKRCLMFFVPFMIGSVLADVPFIENFASHHIGSDTLNSIGAGLGFVGMIIFVMVAIKANVPVHALSAKQLHEFTEQVRQHPELKVFDQGIKAQDRLPKKEDYNRLMKFVEQKEKARELQKAEQEWKALHG